MAYPARIVSLVPSLTELACWLGRGDALVGRTRFCTEPRAMRDHVPTIGGTKDPDVARITALAPDLVIANHEENRREDVEALQSAGLDVLVTGPSTVEEALAMVAELGERLDARAKAAALADETRAEMQPVTGERLRVFVPIWWKPLMSLGGDSYGHDLLEQAGAQNVLDDRQRYPKVTMDEIASLQPDLVLLPDEPYRFREAHRQAFTAIAPSQLIDGKWLWWYGPRMPEALRTLRAIIARHSGPRSEARA